MKIIMAHPTGNQFVRAAAKSLVAAGIGGPFYTTLAVFPGDVLDRLGSVKVLADLKRRRFDLSLRPNTRTRPWLEAARLLSGRLGARALVRHGTGPFSVDAVYRDLDRFVARELERSEDDDVKGVYAYEDGASRCFQVAKRKGIRCFYDLPVGYWRAARAVFERERERWPEWEQTLPGLRDGAQKLRNKDEEIRNADRIFVASKFTATTLSLFPGTLPPVEVIPYGFPPVSDPRTYSVSGRLKVLYVGGLTQRKGIAYLFKAADALKSFISLTVVGNVPDGGCAALDHALGRHRWIRSLPHADVLRLMRTHDVLVFPSLFEGFGLVITEAMSQGTPVITTERTAGPDLIRDKENGWLIEAGSVDSLRSALEDILSDRKAIADAGRSAMESARRRPWSVYGQELTASLLNSISTPVQQHA